MQHKGSRGARLLPRICLKLFDHPLFLLLSTGVLMGLYMPIGKYVGSASLNPVLWAIVISLVPGLILLAFGWPLRLRHLFFGLVAGLTAYVVPNTLVFAAIPRVGAGYVGLMFAVSPVFTAILSMLFNVRPPNRLLLLSVAFGFAGALLIILFRNSLTLGSDGPWPIISFLIPLSLACGNVWRTARWPEGATPVQVGAAANLGAIPLLLLTAILFSSWSDALDLLKVPMLIFTQIAVSLAMFGVFFRLQWVGGPTYLSQIGYVAAAISLAFGTLLFGETYPWPVWVGAALISVGVVISNLKRGWS
jgi:drug/metabolite transporter (DMT)-like permease